MGIGEKESKPDCLLMPDQVFFTARFLNISKLVIKGQRLRSCHAIGFCCLMALFHQHGANLVG